MGSGIVIGLGRGVVVGIEQRDVTWIGIGGCMRVGTDSRLNAVLDCVLVPSCDM